MSYLSAAFAVSVLLGLLLFYGLPKRFRGAVLLVASLLFYASFDGRYLLYLLFVALSSWCCGSALQKVKNKKLLLFGCIGANVFLWFAIKELSWLINLLNTFLEFSPAPILLPYVFRLVPVGLSYYMLQAISYLVDLYRGKLQPEKKFWRYLLYLSYFPAVVQGPISRYDLLRDQFQHEKPFDLQQVTRHGLRILLGMIKKLVVADRLGLLVSHCFTNAQELDGSVLALGAVGFAFQLYADFSGCVDICRGVSGCFGIELPQNFRAPYLARSVKDFWNRWHISFSSWLRDYVYIPLGGNRRGQGRKYFNLMATFLVSGIWHGAGVTYILWGLLHGAYQIVGELTKPLRNRCNAFLEIQQDSPSQMLYQRLMTFTLTTFAWIFFRADSVAAALAYIRRMFTCFHPWNLLGADAYSAVPVLGLILVALHIGVMLAVERREQQGEDVVGQILGLHVFHRWGIYLLLLADLILFGVYGGYDPAAFLYGGY